MGQLTIIEQGYHEILRARDATRAAELPPEMRAAAVLINAAHAYERIDEAIKASAYRPETFLQSLRVEVSGVSIDPNAALGAIIEACTCTLLMEAHLDRWFDNGHMLVLPRLQSPKPNDLSETALVMALAARWAAWEHMERRWRFLGGVISSVSSANLPDWAPADAIRAVTYSGKPQGRRPISADLRPPDLRHRPAAPDPPGETAPAESRR